MEELIKKRLDVIHKMYDKVSEFINSAPLPDSMKGKLITLVLGDNDLKELIAGLKSNRPPRFILVGKTGVGKSTLLNAMCGKYLAMQSDVEVGTKIGKPYPYNFMGQTVFEVIDTRGIGESEEADCIAEDVLMSEIHTFQPDAILYVSEGRAHLMPEINLIKQIQKDFEGKIPVLAVRSKVDELVPLSERIKGVYSMISLGKIKEAERQLRRVLEDHSLSVIDVIPVSSYIEWSDDPNSIDPSQWTNLKIVIDGRYNIDKLLDTLEDNIDLKASIYLMLVTRLDKVCRKIAMKLTKIFAGIAATVAKNPIPISDLMILTPIQLLLITMISCLSGRDMGLESAKDMLAALGLGGAAGYSFKLIFQQASKLLNIIIPGGGSVISAGIASAGTYAIGKASIAFFFDGVTPEQAKEIVTRTAMENVQAESIS